MTEIHGIAYVCPECEKEVLVEWTQPRALDVDDDIDVIRRRAKKFYHWEEGICAECHDEQTEIKGGHLKAIEAKLQPIYHRWAEISRDMYRKALAYQKERALQELRGLDPEDIEEWTKVTLRRAGLSGRESQRATLQKLEQAAEEIKGMTLDLLMISLMKAPEIAQIRKHFYAEKLKLEAQAVEAGLFDLSELWISHPTHEPLTVALPVTTDDPESMLEFNELGELTPAPTAPREMFYSLAFADRFFGSDGFGQIPIFLDEEFTEMLLSELQTTIIDAALQQIASGRKK